MQKAYQRWRDAIDQWWSGAPVIRDTATNQSFYVVSVRLVPRDGGQPIEVSPHDIGQHYAQRRYVQQGINPA